MFPAMVIPLLSNSTLRMVGAPVSWGVRVRAAAAAHPGKADDAATTAPVISSLRRGMLTSADLLVSVRIPVALVIEALAQSPPRPR
ncbi:hypothetical protein ASD25_12765 [Brevundimonas sp. Root1423]|nr:hypothetical protein ASD25_12765 [Brevundimonas sp. Root1423]